MNNLTHFDSYLISITTLKYSRGLRVLSTANRFKLREFTGRLRFISYRLPSQQMGVAVKHVWMCLFPCETYEMNSKVPHINQVLVFVLTIVIQTKHSFN